MKQPSLFHKARLFTAFEFGRSLMTRPSSVLYSSQGCIITCVFMLYSLPDRVAPDSGCITYSGFTIISSNSSAWLSFFLYTFCAVKHCTSVWPHNPPFLVLLAPRSPPCTTSFQFSLSFHQIKSFSFSIRDFYNTVSDKVKFIDGDNCQNVCSIEFIPLSLDLPARLASNAREPDLFHGRIFPRH